MSRAEDLFLHGQDREAIVKSLIRKGRRLHELRGPSGFELNEEMREIESSIVDLVLDLADVTTMEDVDY